MTPRVLASPIPLQTRVSAARKFKYNEVPGS